MKISHIILAVAAILLANIYAGYATMRQVQRKQWQDAISKPTSAWTGEYGYSDDGQLAYCVSRLLRADVNQARLLLDLRRRMQALEASSADPNDPNEVEDPNAQAQ